MSANYTYSVEQEIDRRVCAWCDAPITEGSICHGCMKKYNIKVCDLREDGCGCDTK